MTQTERPKMHPLAERRLIEWWLVIQDEPHELSWEVYDVFRAYALRQGYNLESDLIQPLPGLPWGPGNCQVAPKRQWHTDELESMKQWDDTVNRIRRACGMYEIHSKTLKDRSNKNDV